MEQHDTIASVESAGEATAEVTKTPTTDDRQPERPTEQPAQETPAAEQPVDQPPSAQAPPEEQPPAELQLEGQNQPQPKPHAAQARSAACPKPRTKLVCTIGPATAEGVKELVEAGMDVARINFSHGTPEEHKRAVDAVRASAHSLRRSVAVMVDLPGPKIRLGELAGGEAELEVGRSFVLRRAGDGTNEGSAEGAEVLPPGLPDALQPGDRVLLADGAAELTVTGKADGEVRTEVVRGGIVRSRSGVNVPGSRLEVPALTDADREAIPRALQLKADMVAQSFVRSAADVQELRGLMGDARTPIVVKIETQQAVENFDQIVEVADGVMIARGDLGVDLPFEDVPLIQKMLLRRARDHGRFTIVATQMLESMTAAARPTRAEASDVANAVLDGTDAVMLSAETAIGEYPVEAARAALSICFATERDVPGTLSMPYARLPESHPEALVHAAIELSLRYPRLAAVWCFTRSGRTAETLSMLRPRLPVVAFTTTPIVARRLAIRSAVIPVLMPAARTGEPLIRRMAAAARAQGVGRIGAGGHGSTVLLVTTSGEPDGINRLEIYEV